MGQLFPSRWVYVLWDSYSQVGEYMCYGKLFASRWVYVLWDSYSQVGEYVLWDSYGKLKIAFRL